MFLVASSVSAAEGWPRSIHGGGYRLRVYAPQLDAWDGKRMAWRNAVAVKLPLDPDWVYGALRAEAETRVDLSRDLVFAENVRIVRADFPADAKRSPEDLAAIAADLFPKNPPVPLRFAIDAWSRLPEATLALDSVAVSEAPPRVFVSDRDARLIRIDGPPAFAPVAGTDLVAALNASVPIVFHPPSARHFVETAGRRLVSTNIDGPWAEASRFPDGLDRAFAAFGEEAGVGTEANPQRRPAGLRASGEPRELPSIFATTEPAELLAFDGAADFAPIPGTRIHYGTDCSARVFLDGEGRVYALLSGRWFRARGLSGPWEPAGGELPEDFARIPRDHPASAALASVPGTPEALEASFLARLPRTMRLSRRATIAVEFDGPPVFERVPGTGLEFATNTASEVLRAPDGAHYCCRDAAWFRATSPDGPWGLADAIPPGVSAIPPDHPLFAVRHVRVARSDAEWVEFERTAGYEHVHPDPRGVVVYGTGFVRAPWLSSTAHHGYPQTYGAGASYFPATREFRFADAGLAEPHGRAERSADREAGPPPAYSLAATRSDAFDPAVWGEHLLATDATAIEPTDAPYVAVDPDDDVYVGEDGGVYRRAADGRWLARVGTEWRAADAGAAPPEAANSGPRRGSRTMRDLATIGRPATREDLGLAPAAEAPPASSEPEPAPGAEPPTDGLTDPVPALLEAARNPPAPSDPAPETLWALDQIAIVQGLDAEAEVRAGAARPKAGSVAATQRTPIPAPPKVRRVQDSGGFVRRGATPTRGFRR